MELLGHDVRNQDGWWQKAAGVAALAASLAFTGCEANTGPIEIEPVLPKSSRLTTDRSTAPRSQSGVYILGRANLAENVANFIADHPELRILDIEGDGNGRHGHNTFFSVLTRPAHADEPLQKVEVAHSRDPVQAAFRYRDLNPDREISAMVGDGNGGYGRNTFYVFVTTKTE